jgi:hypothetical protein
MKHYLALLLLPASVTFFSACRKSGDSTDPVNQPAKFDFTVVVTYKDAGIAGFIGQVYEDKTIFDLTVEKKVDQLGDVQVTVTGSNFRNQAPAVTPKKQTYPTPTGTFTYDWVPDGVGMVNITGVKLESFDDSTASLEFIHGPINSPGNFWSSTNPDASGTIPSITIAGGVPGNTIIYLKGVGQKHDPMVELILK